MGKEITSDKYARPFLGILILSGLYVISLYNYLLFHVFAEMFSVIIAFGVFIVAWNARRFMNNNYLLFLGVSFMFVGGLDLLHIFAYSGMELFKGYDGRDLPAQLWIMTRYMQSASFFIALFFIRRSMRVSTVFFVYAVITAILLLAVFRWRAFPESLLDGSELTDFSKRSAIIVAVIFAGAISLLIIRRRDFDLRVLGMLLASIVAAIGTEVSFAFNRSPGGEVNLVGHFTHIISFYFIYAAIIRTGLENPYNLLFRELKQNESLLKEERDRAQKYLDIAEVMFVVVDGDETVGLINKKGCDFLGYTEKEIVGRNWFDVFLPERIREKSRTVFRKMMNREIVPIAYHEDPVLTRRGEEKMIAWQNTLIEDRDGNNTGTLSSGIDITDRKETEEMLKASENKLNAITLALGEGVYILDRMGRLVFMNVEAENILGWKEQELSGKNVHPLVHAHKTASSRQFPEECPITETVNSGKVYRIAEDVFIRKDGTPFPVTLVSTPIRDDGEITGSVVAFHDITVRKRTEEALRRANELLARQATTDALTGIYNRLKFNGLLDMEIRKARRYRMPLALIMFDIDHFKSINDEYGHQAGDSVLQEIARTVAQNIRDADLFSRWGGEEFMILVPENELKNALQLAEKLRMKIEAHQFKNIDKVTCSFGVTQFAEDDTVGSFAKRADDAMYAAKENGRNRTECR
jgi:diguanylate cyclase (GGDEF)-like protein/PAS domain S-box-containing protein